MRPRPIVAWVRGARSRLHAAVEVHNGFALRACDSRTMRVAVQRPARPIPAEGCRRCRQRALDAVMVPLGPSRRAS